MCNTLLSTCHWNTLLSTFPSTGKGGKKKKKGKKKKEEEPKRKIELVADPEDKEEWKKFLNKTQETVAKTKKTLEILR